MFLTKEFGDGPEFRINLQQPAFLLADRVILTVGNLSFWGSFYEVDPLACPKCQGKMSIISFIENEEVIRKILEHLGPLVR
jgi:hypothetical protein